jgi:hypothetical protein
MFFPTSNDGAATTIPPHSLSCDVYEKSQMIIMGSHLTNSTSKSYPACVAR